jgi:hypothetical protein
MPPLRLNPSEITGAKAPVRRELWITVIYILTLVVMIGAIVEMVR